jgi:hypothetical protein
MAVISIIIRGGRNENGQKIIIGKKKPTIADGLFI